MIDLHSHVLPGLDDGASSLEEAVAIVRSMGEDGATVVAATPHVREDYPTTPDAMEHALASVREAVAAEGIGVEVLPGGELDLDMLGRLGPDARERFGLGGNPGVLLLETPYGGWPLVLETVVRSLGREGIVTVLAHPERNRDVISVPLLLEPIVRAGAVVQLTAASLDGRLGKAVRQCAQGLLELELAHLLASDAHEPAVRAAGLSGARRSVGDEALGRWLTSEVPAALLAGSPLPPRPEGGGHARRWWRRGA